MTLPNGYTFRELTREEFQPLWTEHAKKIFDENAQIFRVYQSLSDEERARADALAQNLGKPYHLRLAVFHGEEFVGWHVGNQESSETYYMRNSAILPEHRRRGLYAELLAEVLRRVTEMGFQRIFSRHTATNNAVIIPKLKAGFVITGMELSDAFGTLVHLAYFPKALRRKMLDYRAGESKPDQEIRHLLSL